MSWQRLPLPSANRVITGDCNTGTFIGRKSPYSHSGHTGNHPSACPVWALRSDEMTCWVRGGERDLSSSNQYDQHLLLNIYTPSTAHTQRGTRRQTIRYDMRNLLAQLFHELFTYFPCSVAGRHFQKFKAPKNRFPSNENRGNWIANWGNRRTHDKHISVTLTESLDSKFPYATVTFLDSKLIEAEIWILCFNVSV
jgi:hypothetical protein